MPFDVRQLIPLLGGAGGAIGHNPIGGNAFLQGWQQAEQEHQAQIQKQQEDTRQQELLKLQQNQDTRASNADTRAQQEQYLNAVNSVRQLLGDQSIQTPDEYAQREQFVMQLAPKLGVDTGFVQSLRPTPDVYTRRKLQRVYDQFSKLPDTERLQFEQGGHWNIDGQMFTPAQARQALGIGGQTTTGEPFVFSKPAPTQAEQRPGSLEQQYLDAINKGDTKTAARIREAANIRDNQSGGLFSGNGSPNDVKDTVDAIIRGDQPPTLQGFYGNTLKVRAELGRRGYDFSTANLDWQATQQHWKTLNGAQQTRMRQAVDNASHSLDVIQSLADQWKGGNFPILNKARLTAAKQGVLGPQAQKIATALEAQISDVTSELANVYMGGNSPTDHAMQLAAKNLQADWSEPQLRALINQQRTNLQIRMNSIKNAQAITPTSQQPDQTLTQPTTAVAPTRGGVPNPFRK